MLSDKNILLKRYNRKKIESILSIDQNNIDPIIELHYNGKLQILEAPLFFSSKNIVRNNILYLRSHSFTGLEGHLSPNRTHDIIHRADSEEFLKFLSIFSGRLYRLRCNYLFTSLQQGNALSLKNSLIGYHYPIVFCSAKAIGVNKNIDDLMDVVRNKFSNIQIKSHLSYTWTEIKNNKKLLGSMLLGSKMIVKNLTISFVFNSYNIFLENRENLRKLKNLILIYTPFFHIKYFISSHSKILLGKYLLGNYNI